MLVNYLRSIRMRPVYDKWIIFIDYPKLFTTYQIGLFCYFV